MKKRLLALLLLTALLLAGLLFGWNFIKAVSACRSQKKS